MTYITKEETYTQEDAEGNLKTSKKTQSIQYTKNEEPDFIKIYTKMWCEFNEIPNAYRELFLQLALNMSYCNSMNLESSQVVATGGPVKQNICEKLMWKDSMYQKGLRALCDCNAIKKIARGFYQINPNYAGRGSWKYNPKANQGGIEDLVAVFKFKDREVETKIVWADDGTETPLNKDIRAGLNVEKKDEAVISILRAKKKD